MVEYTKEDVLQQVREKEYPIDDVALLSEVQAEFANERKNREAACIAQWVVQTEGGRIDTYTFSKLCMPRSKKAIENEFEKEMAKARQMRLHQVFGK